MPISVRKPITGWTAALAATTLFFGCAENPTSTTKNVFGRDDRIGMTSSEYPWSTIGRLISHDNTCTGSLVGKDLVLTNSHCVFRVDGSQRDDLRFHPAYKAGDGPISSGYAHVWRGALYRTETGADDWALLRLNSPLGHQFGFLGTKTLSDAELQSVPVTLPGYSGDYQTGDTAGVHMDCKIRGSSNDMLEHDCDSSPGASGAPILAWFGGEPMIVALNSGERRGNGPSLYGIDYTSASANLAVKLSRFVATIGDKRNSDDGSQSATTIFLCNESDRPKVFASLVVYTGGSWQARGWYGVASAQCMEVFLPDRFSGDIYLYAEFNQGEVTWQGQDASFCVNKADAFTYDDADTINCQNSDQKRVKFRKLGTSHGAFNKFTFTD